MIKDFMINRVLRFLFGWAFRFMMSMADVKIRTDEYGGHAQRLMIISVNVPYCKRVEAYKIKANGTLDSDSRVYTTTIKD